MPAINQAKKQKKIEHFPYITLNPSWFKKIAHVHTGRETKSSTFGGNGF